MTDPIAIYFATVTGNAEELAGDACSRCREAGLTPMLHNLADMTPESLKQTKYALFIVSTWGDGEPPDDAADFFDELQDSDENLAELKYSVMGLGDQSYPDFNAFARNLDKELQTRSAKTFHDRVEADIDYDDTYEQWINPVVEKLSSSPEPQAASAW